MEKKNALAEHSPIRKLQINWKWYDLKYWVSVHFVRHKFGIEHWVSSQRPDRGRTGNRDEEPQSAPVEHECLGTSQAIINISRKRFCSSAMPDTRIAWRAFIAKLAQIEPELSEVCVPDCIYRGWCYEYESCGFHLTEQYQHDLKKYRQGINGF